jgi:hypothetical protein
MWTRACVCVGSFIGVCVLKAELRELAHGPDMPVGANSFFVYNWNDILEMSLLCCDNNESFSVALNEITESVDNKEFRVFFGR